MTVVLSRRQLFAVGVAVCVLFSLLAFACGAWSRSVLRAERAESERDVAVWRLRAVEQGCVSDAAGGGVCKPRTFSVPTTSTTAAR